MAFTRLPLPAASGTHPRCFRTDEAGRIPVIRDWRKLFAAARQLECVALETRHACARLIRLGPMPELAWDDRGHHAADEAGTLHLRCATWGEACGRLELCGCCASPGVIEVRNATGAPFLQLCPPPHSEPAAWADFLADVAAPPPAIVTGCDRPLAGFALLPDGLPALAGAAAALPGFLARLRDNGIRLRVLLRTPEMTQVGEFTPRWINGDQPLFCAGDDALTLQLALPAVQGFGLGPDGSLHVAGHGRTLLLSLTAADPQDRRIWNDALGAAFPGSQALF